MFDKTKARITAQIHEPIKNNAVIAITALVLALVGIAIAVFK